jgi:hypothetical protein
MIVETILLCWPWVTIYLGHFFTWVTFYLDLGHFLPGSLFYLGHFLPRPLLPGPLYTWDIFKTWVTGSLIPHPRVSRQLCLLEMCGEMSTRRRVWVSRVQKTLQQHPPTHARTTPSPPPTTRVLFLSDSVEGRQNFPHMTIHWSMEHRPGGRNMVPTCAWPILILRGMSQPTPNAPEAPRTAGVSTSLMPMCLDIFIFSYPPPSEYS